MIDIGKMNLLRVARQATPGFYLEGGDLGDILLPFKLAPDGLAVGSEVNVFVHRDSEDRLLATTERPKAMVGEFAALRVISVTPGLGAFLDWGLAKDLLLPFREMDVRVQQGDRVVAYVFLDEKTDRVLATTRLRDRVSQEPPTYAVGHPVNLLIARETPLGFMALIEHQHLGLLYRSPLSQHLECGEEVQGYIAAIRPDGKIDLTLESSGAHRVLSLSEQILEELKASGGRLKLDDDSSPEEIRARFAASKKAFKQAIGALYRQRQIRLTKPGIELIR